MCRPNHECTHRFQVLGNELFTFIVMNQVLTNGLHHQKVSNCELMISIFPYVILSFIIEKNVSFMSIYFPCKIKNYIVWIRKYESRKEKEKKAWETKVLKFQNLGAKLVGELPNFNGERNIKEVVEGKESPLKVSWKNSTKVGTNHSPSKGRKVSSTKDKETWK